MFGAVYFNLFALLLVCAAPLSRSTRARSILGRPLAGLLLGGLSAVMIFSHFAAIARIDAAYMIAVKRTSLLFGVLYGGLWFREEHIAERLLGAALMLAGVLLIAWLG
jgi:drug/metabolite transporter (DMT)-like permease